MSFNNLRPGVYSSYHMSASYATPRSRKAAGVVLETSLPEGVLHSFASMKEVEAVFAGLSTANDTVCQQAIALLFHSGVGAVHFSSVKGSYSKAVALLESVDSVGIVFSNAAPANAALLMQSVKKSSEIQRERLLFLGSETLSAAVALATELNSERCVVTLGKARYQERGHALFGAVALGGALLAGNNPRINLNGYPLQLLDGLETRASELEIQQALAGGITPLELVGGAVSCVRAVTSRHKNSTGSDTSMRSINAILIIDDVISAVRTGLKAKLSGTPVVPISLESIASQVMIELSQKKDDGLLRAFEAPRVYAHLEDAEVCVVELAFHAVSVLSQIHIKAFVQL